MAFAETRAATSPRLIKDAAGIMDVTITSTATSEIILCGDLLGVDYPNKEWTLSAGTTFEHPTMIALEDAYSGDTIKAALMAIVEVVTTSTNAATVGEVAALSDAGAYQVAGGGLPDVGFVVSVGGDSLSAVMVICPAIPRLTTQRA